MGGVTARIVLADVSIWSDNQRGNRRKGKGVTQWRLRSLLQYFEKADKISFENIRPFSSWQLQIVNFYYFDLWSSK